MENAIIRDHLVKELGFWPLEGEENTFAKNAPSLSVIYVLVKIESDCKISIIERTEKTVFGHLKHYDKIICSLNSTAEDFVDKLEDVLESHKE